MKRNQWLGLIHKAKNDLCLSDAAYRDCLRLQCGVDSAADLNQRQAQAMLDHFKNKGWNPQFKSKKRKNKYYVPDDPQGRMVVGMWIELCKDGIIRQKTETTFMALVKRACGRDHLRFCDPSDKHKVIELFKAMRKE